MKKNGKKKGTSSSLVTLKEKSKNGDSLIFGGNLQLMMNGSIDIPMIIMDMIDNISTKGVNVEGIFRKSAGISELQDLKNRINNGKSVNVSDHDPITIAALLKLFLRELQTPLFVPEVIPQIDEHLIGKDMPSEKVRDIIKDHIIPILPKEHKIFLKRLTSLMSLIVQHSAVNLMTTTNLSVVMAPNLFRSPNMADEFRIFASTQLIVSCLIDNHDYILSE